MPPQTKATAYTPGAERAANLVLALELRTSEAAEIISRETHDAEMLEALRRLVGVFRDLHNVYQNRAAEWIMEGAAFTEAEALIRKVEGQP